MRFALRSASSARLVLAVLIGAGIGVALAQDRPPGQLDSACATQCLANGNDAEFCDLVCWVPDPEVAARSEPVHWKCYSTCRANGGKPEDCLPACRRR
jgi:hypothetical protein